MCAMITGHPQVAAVLLARRGVDADAGDEGLAALDVRAVAGWRTRRTRCRGGLQPRHRRARASRRPAARGGRGRAAYGRRREPPISGGADDVHCRRAARAAPGADGVLIVSVDQPASDALLASLRCAWLAKRPLLAVPSLDGRAGHPPCSTPRCCPTCSPSPRRARGCARSSPDTGRTVSSCPRATRLPLTNLNTRDDYERRSRRRRPDMVPRWRLSCRTVTRSGPGTPHGGMATRDVS